MQSAKNSLGRGTGRRFNMAAVKRELEAREIAKSKRDARRARRQEADRQYRLAHPVNPFTGKEVA